MSKTELWQLNAETEIRYSLALSNAIETALFGLIELQQNLQYHLSIGATRQFILRLKI